MPGTCLLTSLPPQTDNFRSPFLWLAKPKQYEAIMSVRSRTWYKQLRCLFIYSRGHQYLAHPTSYPELSSPEPGLPFPQLLYTTCTVWAIDAFCLLVSRLAPGRLTLPSALFSFRALISLPVMFTPDSSVCLCLRAPLYPQ